MTLPYNPNNPPDDQQGVPPSGVFIGPVFTDDNLSAYEDNDPDQQNEATVWTDYRIRNRYVSAGQTCMMAIASPFGFSDAESNEGGPTVAFAQLAAPTLLWVSDWTACRWGKQPLIPDPIPTGDWILLKHRIDTNDLPVDAGGVSALYRVSGQYVYGQLRPAELGIENMCFGHIPYLSDNFDRTIPLNKFRQGIINIPEGPTLRTVVGEATLSTGG